MDDELDRATKRCPYGHGDMLKEAGLWALPGVKIPEGSPRVKTARGEVAELQMRPDTYVCSLWRCPVCKAIQLFDEEV